MNTNTQTVNASPKAIASVNTVAGNRAAAMQNYTEAFLRCYPSKNIKVEAKRVKKEYEFIVTIDGDTGGRSLSYTDMLSATADFQRGRV